MWLSHRLLGGCDLLLDNRVSTAMLGAFQKPMSGDAALGLNCRFP
ncbi:uncharacterized protein G2W53_021862 [Senna tora]|uniref:Uncharacterized protein n=1 Tax=Senna tora TaxID=362788 RepID=A0A834TKB4_9FABA|nr:uncharacterized protein G2W53_021862 [Senna tora]